MMNNTEKMRNDGKPSIPENMNHRRFLGLCVAIILGLTISFTVNGQVQEDEALVPLPSVPDFTRGGGWGIALGAGSEYEVAYDGAEEYALELAPAGAIQWRSGNHVLFWEGIEAGWRARLADIWLIQTGLRNEYGLGPDDSEDGYLDGFEERDSHIAGFLEVRRAFGEDWKNWIGVRTMGGESGFGWLGVLAAGHRFGDRLDGTGTEIYVFSTFGTGKFINKDFGVTVADSLGSGLPVTELDGGYRSTGINLIDRRYLTSKIQLITSAGIELYSNGIQDSPVARKDYETEVGLAIVYHF